MVGVSCEVCSACFAMVAASAKIAGWTSTSRLAARPTILGEMIDDNLNPLTWWTEKHNKYASREAVDLLNPNTTSCRMIRSQACAAASRRASSAG